MILRNMNYLTGQLFALTAAVCWAQNSMIYSWIGKKTGSNAVAHVRIWIALPAVMVVNFFFTRSFFPTGLPFETYLYFGLSGFLGFFIADIFIFRSFVFLGPVKTMVIMTFSPVFSAVISWIFLNESLNLTQISGIFIIITGIVLAVSDNDRDSKDSSAERKGSAVIMGTFLAFAGALAQAAGLIIAKYGLTGTAVHPVSANVLRITAGGIGLAAMQLVKKEFISDFIKMAELKIFSLMVSAALAGPVLGIILSLYALRIAPAGIVTTLMQMSPVILIPLEYLIYRKTPTIRKISGAVLAAAGASLLFIF